MTRIEWQKKLSVQFGKLGAKLREVGASSRNVFIPDYEAIVPKILDLVLDTELTEDVASPCKVVTAVDAGRRVAAEVRTALNNTGLSNTLELFRENKLSESYDRLVVVVLTFELRVSMAIDDEPFFRTAEDLWSLQTLYERVSALESVEKAERISQYLDQMLEVQFEKPWRCLPKPEASTENFVGRAKELCVLRRMLCEKKPIYITGVGGIGKTQLALHMAELYAPPKGAFLIRYDGNKRREKRKVIRHVILNADFSGYQYSGRDNDARDREYKERLEILRREYRDALLIIDNFDLSRKGMEDVLREAEYRDLVETGVYLVFTTRYATEGDFKIGPLKEKDLLRLMHRYLDDMYVEDAVLKKLIKAVDGHTYMLELMARTMSQSWGMIGPENFLNAFEQIELQDEWYPDILTERNGKFEQEDIYSHLSKVFELSFLTEADRRILRYASLLPVNGMERELFWNAVTECEDKRFRNEDETGKENVINSLVSRGWLRRENNRLAIHPAIRLACIGQLKPTDDNCEAFLEALWVKYNTEKYSKENFPQLAELFVKAHETLEDREGIWSLRAGLFWDRLGEYRKALSYYEKTVNRQTQSKTNAVDLVRTYNKIGGAYINLGERKIAHKSFRKALEMARRNPNIDKDVLAATCHNVGSTYADLGEYQEALKYQLEALRLREEMYPAEHPILAASYNNVGSAYASLGNYTMALENNLKALAIREKTRSADEDLNLAISYNNVGGIYMRLGEYDKALDYLQKALVIRNRMLPADHPALATSYNNVGGLCMVTGKNAEALEHLLKALEIREKGLTPNHPDIAETCANIAWTYYAMGEYESALRYIQRASEIAQRGLAAEHPDLKIYQEAEQSIMAKINE